MCLIVLKGTEVQIAKEDIICYKKVNIIESVIYSEYRNFIYEIGKLYTQPLNINKNVKDPEFADRKAQLVCVLSLRIKHEELQCIPIFTWLGLYGLPYIDVYSVGFHSYELKNSECREANVECIIPKGSEYIQDLSGLICSNQIIISKKL